MMCKIFFLLLAIQANISIQALTINNKSSFQLLAFIQFGKFESNKKAHILHIEQGKKDKFTINDNTELTIAIMQLMQSEESQMASLKSIYSVAKSFNNHIKIVCNDTNAYELEDTRKIFSLTIL